MSATTETDENIKSSEQNPPPPPPPMDIQSEMITDESQAATSSNNRQHVSRLSQFQRNTVHLDDQIHDHVTSHQQQQHHSAPPSHHQLSKSGLDAIHENGEYSSTLIEQTNLNSTRFPRSSTVPYPAYASIRKTDGNIHHSDDVTSIPGTISPGYYTTRQPFTVISTNFQPISPHHQFYGTRPVDILKPTFLLVPKATEQRLVAQLSASNSPISMNKNRTAMKKSVQTTEQSPSITRHVKTQSPTITTIDTSHRHIGLVATANPSPYVHFVNVSYPKQQTSPEPLPESSEIQTNNEYHPAINSSIRSMPNISLTQVSPTFRYVSQPIDEQQQQQILTTNENNTIRSSTAPHIGETDESSVASFDLTHTDLVDMPGSWRYQSIPIRAIPRRQRAPIPQSFLDQQHYLSDSEQVVRSPSYRQQQQQALSNSIPAINRPFDSIRSQQWIPYFPIVRLNEKDLLKISAFYKSMGTLVYVARSLATLYTSDFDAMANLKDWKKLYTGVPIWLFNTGMNPKRTRCIRLIISELGSSFILWDTLVNGASDVRLPKERHITLKSLETGTILALKFDDPTATDEFHQYFVKLSCDPRNADLFDVFNSKRRRPVFLLRKRKIKKSAISKPSQFNHLTKVDEHDRDSLYTFSVLVDDGAITS